MLAAARQVRLVTAGAGLLALVALLIVLFSGSSVAGPATGAAAVVPSDALAYVHVSTDSGRPAVSSVMKLAGRLPDYPLAVAAVQTRLSQVASGGSSSDFAGDIRPWLGREAAFALLNTPTSTAGSLIVLDVRDPRSARAFVARAGAQPEGAYRGVTIDRYPTGTAVAFVSHYLVLGQDASVRESIDVRRGQSQSLSSNPDYRAAAAGEPPDRVLDAYASAVGVRRLLTAQGGFLGALGALLYQPAMTGVTLSVSAASVGARVRVHTALDPTLTKVTGSPVASFTPTLQNEMPAGSMLLLDVTGLGRVAPRVLNAGAAGGVAGQIGPLLSRLGAALAQEGVNVSSIVKLFDGETAVAIGPPSGSGHPPSLIIAAHASDPQAASAQLASLAGPLQRLFPTPSTGSGQAPLLNDRQVDGITAHQLVLTTGLQLDYAVFNGLVVVSTSLDGIAAVAAHRRSIADDPGYRAALAGGPQKVTSLVFLDFSQLLSLVQQTGLVRSSRYRAVGADLAKIRTIGLQSTRGEADTTAELFLEIP